MRVNVIKNGEVVNVIMLDEATVVVTAGERPPTTGPFYLLAEGETLEAVGVPS